MSNSLKFSSHFVFIVFWSLNLFVLKKSISFFHLLYFTWYWNYSIKLIGSRNECKNSYINQIITSLDIHTYTFNCRQIKRVEICTSQYFFTSLELESLRTGGHCVSCLHITNNFSQDTEKRWNYCTINSRIFYFSNKLVYKDQSGLELEKHTFRPALIATAIPQYWIKL